MAEWITNFHFLRPWWFLGLLPAIVLVLLYRYRNQHAGNWQQVINPQLLPFLLQDENSAKRNRIRWLSMAWGIAIIGLAGPTWQKLPQPVHKEDSGLVIILDLSPSMYAEDTTPSRLVRARYKLIDILKQRTEGSTGLVVYGAEAHIVSPLTEDSNTIINLVPSLSPTLLPEYGSHTEAAVDTALKLLTNGGYNQGDLLLITDEVAQPAFTTIRSTIAAAGKFRLSILGVGTQEGAPIPLGSGGFVKDYNGAILIPKLNQPGLNLLAMNCGGIYRSISADDSDIQALLNHTSQTFPNTTLEADRTFDLWDDQGFWFALLLLPIVIACFRKGVIATLILSPFILSQPVDAFEWKDLWQTPDQQGMKALQNEKPAEAQALFENDQWRASAAYQAGNYPQAIEGFIGDASTSGHYNRGNAMARSGDLEGALEAYDQALKINPEMEDAKFNRKLVEELLKQQKQQQDSQENQEGNQEQNQQPSQQQNSKNSEQPDPSRQRQDQSPQEPSSSTENTDQPQSENQTPEAPQEKLQGNERRPEKQEEEKKQKEAEQQSIQELSDIDQGEKNGQGEKNEQAQQELEQWLRRVPDDPGGLLREKFRYQSRMRAFEQQRRPSPPGSRQQERW